MPVTHKNKTKVWQWRDRKTEWLHWLCWLVGVIVVLYCVRLISDRTNWVFVQDAPEQAANMIQRSIPPRWEYINQLWEPLWDTVAIATLGTVIAFVFAVPVSFLAARNTTPHPIVRQLALLAIVTSRSVNSLIWALLLVIVLGPGVLAGVLAIGIRSVGFTAKLFYEGIEEIDPIPVEAIAATGASGAQVLGYAVWPQVFSNIMGVTIYRWDINLRESTIVGLVGAGGIGIQLDASINLLRWGQVSMILILIFITVFISEWVSAKVRELVI